MTDLVFYHAIPSRGATVRWMLEETGAPYEVKMLDLKKGEQNAAEFRAVSAQGKVPAIVHKGVAMAEVAAICLYLADAFAQAKLNVPLGDAQRGPYLQWMFFNPSALEPAMMDGRFPRNPAPPPTAIGHRDLGTLLDVVESALKGKDYLVANRFTAVDLVTGAGLNFGMSFGMIPERAALREYVERLKARPAYGRAQEKDRQAAAA